MRFKLIFVIFIAGALSACANFTKLGDDASTYQSSIPAPIQQTQFLNGARIYFLPLEEDVRYKQLSQYDQKQVIEHHQFFMSHIKPKILALGGAITTSKDQANLVLSPLLSTETNLTTLYHLNLLISAFSLFTLPGHQPERIELDITAASQNGQFSENYSFKANYTAWFGGTLSLFTLFGGDAKAEAIDDATNQFLATLESDGIIEEALHGL